jgi:hypothetical protein
MNLIIGYPSYQISKNTKYRVPPGWNRLACSLLEELEGMRAVGLVGKDFHVISISAEGGVMVLSLGGTYRIDNTSGLLAVYADRSRRTCTECGYEGLLPAGMWRPTCNPCLLVKNRRIE